jgi:hypothetical protein
MQLSIRAFTTRVGGGGSLMFAATTRGDVLSGDIISWTSVPEHELELEHASLPVHV